MRRRSCASGAKIAPVPTSNLVNDMAGGVPAGDAGYCDFDPAAGSTFFSKKNTKNDKKTWTRIFHRTSPPVFR